MDFALYLTLDILASLVHAFFLVHDSENPEFWIDLWPLSLKSKRNCIANESLKIIQLIIKKCSTFDH
jgi:hypothetical protein